jgi:hypothetical protein
MRLDPGARRPLRTALILCAASAMLAGCSASGSIRGPSWNLTGGRDSVPPPPKPAEPLRPVATPSAPAAPVVTYRGGRDPVTGRAPSLGGPPQGLDQRGWDRGPESVQPMPVNRPAAAPVMERAPLPPVAPAAAPVINKQGHRTVDVLPGHSLAMIAKRHNVSIAALMQVNGLRDPYVYPGQQLVLP